jgi:ribosomal protein S18 acetylase RimI-like enzyme
MIVIRRALPADLDFLVAADLTHEGYTPSPDEQPMTADELSAHREKIAAFVREESEAGWLAEDPRTGQPVGMILARFRDRQNEPPTEANLFLFCFLDDSLFPADGRFCEIFQLWVQPEYRRQGLATRLKQTVEAETRCRGMQMIYTHTEVANAHVIELNLRLGYQPVRTGPLWDATPRTSLVKWLEAE